MKVLLLVALLAVAAVAVPVKPTSLLETADHLTSHMAVRHSQEAAHAAALDNIATADLEWAKNMKCVQTNSRALPEEACKEGEIFRLDGKTKERYCTT